MTDDLTTNIQIKRLPSLVDKTVPVAMGMSKLTFLVLLALIAVPLSTVKGSSKLNDLMPDSENVKQDKG